MLPIIGLYVFVNNTLPVVDIFDKTILIPVIELGAFSGKTAAENVQKIIKAKAEELLKITTGTTTTCTTETPTTPM
jgi:hypothetical protein